MDRAKCITCTLAIAIGVAASAFIKHPNSKTTTDRPASSETADPLHPNGEVEQPIFAEEVESQSYASLNLSNKTPPPISSSGKSASARLTREAVLALADRCAPSEPSKVLASIVRVESANDPLKIGVNGPKPYALSPSSPEEAVSIAFNLIGSGKNIDLGLGQINSRNLAALNLSIEKAFDPCHNLAAAAVIMARGYRGALKFSPQNRPLLQTAYSLYNTGDLNRGLTNGYVDKVENSRSFGSLVTSGR